jgi:hypothetical protein
MINESDKQVVLIDHWQDLVVCEILPPFSLLEGAAVANSLAIDD